MKAVVAAFNQEKALVGAFSVITNLRMELFGAQGGPVDHAVDGPQQGGPRLVVEDDDDGGAGQVVGIH